MIRSLVMSPLLKSSIVMASLDWSINSGTYNPRRSSQYLVDKDGIYKLFSHPTIPGRIFGNKSSPSGHPDRRQFERSRHKEGPAEWRWGIAERMRLCSLPMWHRTNQRLGLG